MAEFVVIPSDQVRYASHDEAKVAADRYNAGRGSDSYQYDARELVPLPEPREYVLIIRPGEENERVYDGVYTLTKARNLASLRSDSMEIRRLGEAVE